MIKAYYNLVKPGIIYGNIITAVAGFLFASKDEFSAKLFLATIIGLACVIASACVANNLIDQDIDAKMDRTRARELVVGKVKQRYAVIFSIILGIVGFGSLLLVVNILTTSIAALGYIIYVLLYTTEKRKTMHGALIGSLSGAVPPVVGYCAVTNHFDLIALLLCLVLAIWQMPHFYSIAIYRSNDYSNAGIPVMPLKKGNRFTKYNIVIYIIGFIIADFLLYYFGKTKAAFIIVTVSIALIWLYKAIKGFRAADENRWARGMFKFSLFVLLTFSVMLSVNRLF